MSPPPSPPLGTGLLTWAPPPQKAAIGKGYMGENITFEWIRDVTLQHGYKYANTEQLTWTQTTLYYPVERGAEFNRIMVEMARVFIQDEWADSPKDPKPCLAKKSDPRWIEAIADHLIILSEFKPENKPRMQQCVTDGNTSLSEKQRAALVKEVELQTAAKTAAKKGGQGGRKARERDTLSQMCFCTGELNICLGPDCIMMKMKHAQTGAHFAYPASCADCRCVPEHLAEAEPCDWPWWYDGAFTMYGQAAAQNHMYVDGDSVSDRLDFPMGYEGPRDKGEWRRTDLMKGQIVALHMNQYKGNAIFKQGFDCDRVAIDHLKVNRSIAPRTRVGDGGVVDKVGDVITDALYRGSPQLFFEEYIAWFWQQAHVRACGGLTDILAA